MHIIVAERAQTNEDGTFSVHRGGIDRWSTPTLPLLISVHLLIEIAADELPVGDHPFTVKVTGIKGQSSDPHGVLRVVAGATHVRMAFELQLAPEEYGTATITVEAGDASSARTLAIKPVAGNAA